MPGGECENTEEVEDEEGEMYSSVRRDRFEVERVVGKDKTQLARLATCDVTGWNGNDRNVDEGEIPCQLRHLEADGVDRAHRRVTAPGIKYSGFKGQLVKQKYQLVPTAALPQSVLRGRQDRRRLLAKISVCCTRAQDHRDRTQLCKLGFEVD